MTPSTQSAPAFTSIMAALAQLDPSKTNPRKRFDPASLQELADTMKPPVGVLEPLVVRPLAGGVPDRFEIVAGERRWRAAKLAGLTHVPIVVRQLTDEQVIEIQIIENEQRKDIHALEQSDAFVAWQKINPSLTPRALATRIGMSERYVQNLLHYQKLTPDVRQAFYDGRIAAGHADLIVRLKAEQQKPALGACYAVQNVDPEDQARGLFPHEAPSTKSKQQIERLVSVRELDEWIKHNVRLVVDASNPEMELFPDLRQALTAKPIPGAESVKAAPVLLEVTQAWRVHGANAKGPQPVPRGQWRPVEGKNHVCEFAERAVVVIGRGRGQILQVCRATGKCKKHWSETIRSAPPPSRPTSKPPTKQDDAALKRAREAERRAQEQQQRAREREKLLDTVWLRVIEDIAPKVAPNKPSPALLRLMDWNAGGGGHHVKTWRDVIVRELGDVGSYGLNRKDVFEKVAAIIKPLGIDLVKLVAEEESSSAQKARQESAKLDAKGRPRKPAKRKAGAKK